MTDLNISRDCDLANLRHLEADVCRLQGASYRLWRLAGSDLVERSQWTVFGQAWLDHDLLAVECLMSFARLVDPDFYVNISPLPTSEST
jgi:hypothetical protein